MLSKVAVKPRVLRPGNRRTLQNENTALTIMMATPCRPEAAMTALHDVGANAISTSDSVAAAKMKQNSGARPVRASIRPVARPSTPETA